MLHVIAWHPVWRKALGVQIRDHKVHMPTVTMVGQLQGAQSLHGQRMQQVGKVHRDDL